MKIDESEQVDLKIARYIFEKIEFNISHMIPKHILASSRIERELDLFAGAIIYNFRIFLAGQKTEKEYIDTTMKVPVSWWDHFKEHFAPAWFLKWWPIEYQIISIKKTVFITKVCPHIEIPPNDKKHFEIFTAAVGG